MIELNHSHYQAVAFDPLPLKSNPQVEGTAYGRDSFLFAA
jgi:hypothetical protein